MGTYPAQVKTMLKTYGKQLTSAKRLARFRRALKMAGAQDQVTISREAKRREMVERVAKEIIENLIVSGTDTPIVTQIMQELESDFNRRIILEYPLDGDDMVILMETEAGPVEAEPEEARVIMQRLWDLTLETVNATML